MGHIGKRYNTFKDEWILGERHPSIKDATLGGPCPACGRPTTVQDDTWTCQDEKCMYSKGSNVAVEWWYKNVEVVFDKIVWVANFTENALPGLNDLRGTGSTPQAAVIALLVQGTLESVINPE